MMSDEDETNEEDVGLPVYEVPKRYFDQSHWIRPTKSKSGAASDKFIHIGVGHALSNWEHVEAAICSLFSCFVDSHSVAAARAFGSITGSRAKSDAIEQAGEAFFALRRRLTNQKLRKTIQSIDDMQSSFGILLLNYRKAAARRNDIAHGVAFELSLEESEIASWFLIPSFYASNHVSSAWIPDDIKLREKKGMAISDKEARFAFSKLAIKNAEYVYDPGDLKTIAGKFAYLFADILDFMETMSPQRRFSSEALRMTAYMLSR